MIKLTFILYYLVLFHMSVFSEATLDSNNYFIIKKFIDTGNIAKAKIELQKALSENPHDPTLNLYQSEVWIYDADKAYQNGNNSLALKLFEDAVKVYPSNPILQSRLKELKLNKKKPLLFIPNAMIPNDNISDQNKYSTDDFGAHQTNKQILYAILFFQIVILIFLIRLNKNF